MKVSQLEVCGFRSYGRDAQRLVLGGPLAVVHAGNSQGKTSLAEAFEFLLTGGNTRRLLLGGSPSEYEDALRNAHLSPSDTVYVSATLTGDDGTSRVLRRELVRDYRGASDCESKLTWDGKEVDNVIAAGIALADPPLAAPVLLEHTLRYAVSARPADRGTYFKAVLEVTDLDRVRQTVESVIAEREKAPLHPLIGAFRDASATEVLSRALEPLRVTYDINTANRALLGACHAALSDSSVPNESIVSAAARMKSLMRQRQTSILPLSHFTSIAVDQVDLPPQPATLRQAIGASQDHEASSAITAAALMYSAKVAEVDAQVARNIPLLRAAMAVPHLASVDHSHPLQCPLCATPGALTADRIAAVRAHVADHELLSSLAIEIHDYIEGLVRYVEGLGVEPGDLANGLRG